MTGISAEGFEIGDEVGRGGFGIVYKARQIDLGRDVAVKVLHGGIPDDMTRARFEHECRVVGSLPANPAIVPVHHAGLTDSGAPFLAMAYLPGGTLAQRIPLPPAEVVRIGAALADGLAVAHDGGVVHRDVKPSNVLFDGADRPVLVDFGIASLAGDATTASGNIALSLGYASPETLEGERVGVPADVYALGATLFAALTGSAPFTVTGDNSIAGLAARIATRPVENLRPRGVPDVLCRVIETAMAKDPKRRYASMAQMHSALLAVAAAPGLADAVTVPGAAFRQRRRRVASRRTSLITGTVALILAGGYGAYAVSSGGDDPRPVAGVAPGGTQSPGGGPDSSDGRGPNGKESTSPSRSAPKHGTRAGIPVVPGAAVTVTLPNGDTVLSTPAPRLGGLRIGSEGSSTTTTAPKAQVKSTTGGVVAPPPTTTTSHPAPTLSGSRRCTFSAATGSSVDVSQACPGWTGDWYPSTHASYYANLVQTRFTSTNPNSNNGSDPAGDGSYWHVSSSAATTTTYYYRLRIYYLSSGTYVPGELSAQTDTITITFT